MSPVVVSDKGYKATLARLEACRSLAITVGVHEAEGAASDGSLTVAQVAEINEFGLGPPARPAITGWAESVREEFPRMIGDRMKQAIRAKRSPVQALDQLALWAAGQVQARIADGVPPPNAPSTIARKGSSTPLIDKGIFRASIRGRVSNAETGEALPPAPAPAGGGKGKRRGGRGKGKRLARRAGKLLARAGKRLARLAGKRARRAKGFALASARVAGRFLHAARVVAERRIVKAWEKRDKRLARVAARRAKVAERKAKRAKAAAERRADRKRTRDLLKSSRKARGGLGE